ncbi:hypothetical protein L4D76_01710 [Photobacterium sagamiensis]
MTTKMTWKLAAILWAGLLAIALTDSQADIPNANQSGGRDVVRMSNG